jgi:hypothetical protein
MTAVSVYPERSPPEVAKSPRRRLLRRLALVGVAAATVVFALLDARAASGAARLLGHVWLGWLGLAVAAEAASLLSFGRLRRVLLCAAQVAPRRDRGRDPGRDRAGEGAPRRSGVGRGLGVPPASPPLHRGPRQRGALAGDRLRVRALSDRDERAPHPPRDSASTRQAWQASLSQRGCQGYAPWRSSCCTEGRASWSWARWALALGSACARAHGKIPQGRGYGASWGVSRPPQAVRLRARQPSRDPLGSGHRDGDPVLATDTTTPDRRCLTGTSGPAPHHGGGQGEGVEVRGRSMPSSGP